jgi:hypothetical protein
MSAEPPEGKSFGGFFIGGRNGPGGEQNRKNIAGYRPLNPDYYFIEKLKNRGQE